MNLKDFEVSNDKFELDEGYVFGLSFPCFLCRHQSKKVTDEPCKSCGHNVNAEREEDK